MVDFDIRMYRVLVSQQLPYLQNSGNFFLAAGQKSKTIQFVSLWEVHHSAVQFSAVLHYITVWYNELEKSNLYYTAAYLTVHVHYRLVYHNITLYFVVTPVFIPVAGTWKIS